MLQFEHIKLIRELTNVPLNKIKPVKFGFAINWSTATDYVLAAYRVPENRALIVARVECYTGCWVSGAADFRMYGTPPPGYAWWISATDAGYGGREDITNPATPAHLTLDSDELLLFQQARYANILSTLPAPADGLARPVYTRVFGYLVPPLAIDVLSAPEDFIAVQQ